MPRWIGWPLDVSSLPGNFLFQNAAMRRKRGVQGSTGTAKIGKLMPTTAGEPHVISNGVFSFFSP